MWHSAIERHKNDKIKAIKRARSLRSEGLKITEVKKILDNEGFRNWRGLCYSQQSVGDFVRGITDLRVELKSTHPSAKLKTRCLELKEQGFSTKEACQKLNKEGFVNRFGKPISIYSVRAYYYPKPFRY